MGNACRKCGMTLSWHMVHRTVHKQREIVDGRSVETGKTYTYRARCPAREVWRRHMTGPKRKVWEPWTITGEDARQPTAWPIAQGFDPDEIEVIYHGLREFALS